MGWVIKEVKPLQFEWDEGNKKKNWERHQVDFQECEEIFFNKKVKTFYDIKHSQKEDRFITLGTTDKKRKLTVVFAARNNKIRIISARDMSRKERKLYEEK